jgi:hypothetical protein
MATPAIAAVPVTRTDLRLIGFRDVSAVRSEGSECVQALSSSGLAGFSSASTTASTTATPGEFSAA